MRCERHMERLHLHVADNGVSGATKYGASGIPWVPYKATKKGLGVQGGGVIGGDVFVLRSRARVPHYKPLNKRLHERPFSGPIN